MQLHIYIHSHIHTYEINIFTNMSSMRPNETKINSMFPSSVGLTDAVAFCLQRQQSFSIAIFMLPTATTTTTTARQQQFQVQVQGQQGGTTPTSISSRFYVHSCSPTYRAECSSLLCLPVAASSSFFFFL